MVAGQIHDPSTDGSNSLVHDRSEVPIASRFSRIGKVPSQDQKVRSKVGLGNESEAGEEIVTRMNARKQFPLGQKVNIRDLDEEVVGH
jgi:hypothetical protein